MRRSPPTGSRSSRSVAPRAPTRRARASRRVGQLLLGRRRGGGRARPPPRVRNARSSVPRSTTWPAARRRASANGMVARLASTRWPCGGKGVQQPLDQTLTCGPVGDLVEVVEHDAHVDGSQPAHRLENTSERIVDWAGPIAGRSRRLSPADDRPRRTPRTTPRRRPRGAPQGCRAAPARARSSSRNRHRPRRSSADG